MALPTYDIELVNTTMLANNTISLSFKVHDANFSFKAGQFVSIRFDYEGEACKRSYSIACSPLDFAKDNIIEIALGLISEGRASRCFQTAPAGTQYILAGPAGVLTIPEELPESLVLVATGTGLAPYRSMIPELKNALNQGVKVRVIMGVRHREDLFYHQDFQALANEFTHAAFDVCFSREKNIHSDQNEYQGYVQDRFGCLDLVPGKDLVYLCGNPAMIDDGLVWLKEAGFTNRQLRREKYTFSR